MPSCSKPAIDRNAAIPVSGFVLRRDGLTARGSAQEEQERVLNPLELEYKLMSATLWVLENQLSQLLYKNSKCSEQLRHLSSPKYPMLEDASYCL